METFVFHKDRGNAVEWFLYRETPDGTKGYVDASLFTRFMLDFDGEVVDSDTVGIGSGEAFDNTVQVTDKDGDSAYALTMRSGVVANVDPGRYMARLICFDTDHPSGLVWGKPVPIAVIA